MRSLKEAGAAEAAYRRAIAAAPRYAEPWNGLGALLVEAKRPRARYVVPFLPNRALIALAEFLPTEASDALIQGLTGMRSVRS